MTHKLAILLLFPCLLFAILIGNPADPTLKTIGLFTPVSSFCSLRMAVFDDVVYCQRFRDEFQLEGRGYVQTYLHLCTNAGMMTLNLKNWIDLYGILGASRLQLNREVYSNMQLAWGVGGKIAFFKTENFFFGADFKYFTSDQKPLFFACDGLPFNVARGFMFQYHEIQTAVGMCYRTAPFAPYIHATYLIAKIDPIPNLALVRWPFSNILVSADCKAAVTHRRWGLAVGATIISGDKTSFTIESRMFNQNAIDAYLDLRF